MRLLDTTTLKLEEFNRNDAPPYAILSHTWGDEEVTFQEMCGGDPRPTWKSGYQKIAWTCQQALVDDIPYAWVDTCCIDKTSSAELSEAINSMFMWYESAKVCYAYLEDVPSKPPKAKSLWKCKWITRGWTLQELLAPRKLIFFSSDWTFIGNRDNLAASIAVATGIDASYLKDGSKSSQRIGKASIAQRMGWAAGRKTSRPEDLAYCLLGVFGINMPLLYGEGRRSFIRLQEEILRRTDDVSIFAWTLNLVESSDGMEDIPDSDLLQSQMEENYPLALEDVGRISCIFAPSPAAFGGSRDIRCVDVGEDTTPFSLTNRGIRFDIRLLRRGRKMFLLLPCQNRRNQTTLLAIRLVPLIGNRFARLADEPLEWIEYHEWPRVTTVPGYLITDFSPGKWRPPSNCLTLRSVPDGFVVKRVSEGYAWYRQENIITKSDPWTTEYGGLETITISLVPLQAASYSQVSITLNFRQFKVQPAWYFPDTSSRHNTLWAYQDVTYTDRKSGSNSHSKPQKAVFAEISYQHVFGNLIVVDIHSTSDLVLIRRLRRRDRIHYLISAVCFMPMDWTRSWTVLKYWLALVEMAIRSTYGLALLVLITLVADNTDDALRQLLISDPTPWKGPKTLRYWLVFLTIFDIIIVAFARRLIIIHLYARVLLDGLALGWFIMLLLDPEGVYIISLNMLITYVLSTSRALM